MKVLNNFKKGEGFTLIEILVVLGIFTLLGVLIINVFLLSLKAQNQASTRQEAVSNLRFVIETMAQEIRTSEINYGPGMNDQVLNLQSGTNTIRYSLSGGEIELNVNGQISTLNDASEVQVIELHFLIDPPNDPFAEERCNVDGDCVSNDCTVTEDVDKEFKSGFCRCSGSIDCSLNVGNCNAGLCLPFDRQPRVTIILAFQPVSSDTAPIYMQTTISSRIYKR